MSASDFNFEIMRSEEDTAGVQLRASTMDLANIVVDGDRLVGADVNQTNGVDIKPNSGQSIEDVTVNVDYIGGFGAAGALYDFDGSTEDVDVRFSDIVECGWEST
ncbi:hypothetical protein ACOZ32_00445 [Halobacterium sp. MBLA0001]|uniref:hypothetical protein n=1 Tax=Halobacterium sp. MBLA0001 TaxID=3413511 RepID=UPI003C73D205